MTLKVEPLQDHPHHIPLLAQWFQAQWGYLYPERSLQDRQKELAKPPNQNGMPYTLVAIKGGMCIGTASLVTCDMEIYPQLSPWLASVYVKESERQQGVAGILIREIEDFGLRLGHKSINLFTPDKAHYYEKRGYNALEELNYRSEHVTLMNKALCAQELSSE